MLAVEHLDNFYQQQQVLFDITFDVPTGEIVCVLGPSGCGKTTLLRTIAGLETAQSGDIRLEGQSILSTPIHRRGFGLMFQEYALFPHMDVEENIIFGLRMQRVPGRLQQDRLREVLELVGLSGFEKRRVSELSGGERQRVALARSLAPSPRLLMLDEPLGSLDATLKADLAVELRHIIKRVGITSIYVTHDQQEAFSIGDRVLIMRDGMLEQIDTAQNVYLWPRTDFAARFLGLENIFSISRLEDGLAHTAIGTFAVEPNAMPAPRSVLLHPERLQVATTEPVQVSKGNRTLEGVLVSLDFLGKEFKITVELVGKVGRFTLSLPATAVPPATGTRVWVTYRPADAVFLEG
jgi:ABC-type Fe3+/spermidine/putrescine transport system ATPase subunit